MPKKKFFIWKDKSTCTTRKKKKKKNMPQKSMTNSYKWQCTSLECSNGQRYASGEMVWRKQFFVHFSLLQQQGPHALVYLLDRQARRTLKNEETQTPLVTKSRGVHFLLLSNLIVSCFLLVTLSPCANTVCCSLVWRSVIYDVSKSSWQQMKKSKKENLSREYKHRTF